MRAAYRLLLALIGISPALLFVDGPIIHALLVAYAAVVVASVGALMRPGEAGHLQSIIRPFAMMAVIVAVWLIIQVIPLPFKSWAHPIWTDAETALGAPMVGSITIDPGATLVAICRYCSVIGILFVATAVTIDRVRAEQVLLWLVGTTTVAAMVHIIHSVVAFEFLDAAANARIEQATTALSALGIIMTAAAAVRVKEHYEMRRSETDVSFKNFMTVLGLVLVAFGICAISLVIFSRAPVSLVAASGLATLAIVIVIRRLGVGPLAGDTIAALAVAVAVMIVLALAGKHAGSGDATLRYALQTQSSLISMTARIIADTGWLGTGAGTFEYLLPIYRDSSSAPVGIPAPTSAAQIAIELGRPIFAAILITTIVIWFMLLRGALQRGRDSFYPAAGAGCMVVVTLEAFCDASLFSTTVLICTVSVLGLSLGQRVSRVMQ